MLLEEAFFSTLTAPCRLIDGPSHLSLLLVGLLWAFLLAPPSWITFFF